MKISIRGDATHLPVTRSGVRSEVVVPAPTAKKNSGREKDTKPQTHSAKHDRVKKDEKKEDKRRVEKRQRPRSPSPKPKDGHRRRARNTARNTVAPRRRPGGARIPGKSGRSRTRPPSKRQSSYRRKSWTLSATTKMFSR